MKACKIGLFSSWSWSINTISYLGPCCGSMGEELLGSDRKYTIHQYCDELLRGTEETNYCNHCGGKIEFFESHKRYEDWKESFVLKITNNSLIFFKTCCERMAEACREKHIIYESNALRLGNIGVTFCHKCGTKLEISDKMIY